MAEQPRKLNPDAIAEALCEVRFECEQSIVLPELVVAKLVAFDKWKNFQTVRLPLFDVPALIRSSDLNLKFQPFLELREINGQKLAKVGPNALSFHRIAPYPGWAVFEKEIYEVLEFLFNTSPQFKATRIGFRYINIFNDSHGIQSVSQLNYSIKVANKTLICPQNINYIAKYADSHFVHVRISSPEFVSIPEGTNANILVDLDVFTDVAFNTSDVELAKKWIKSAHTYEKKEFFKLFTPEMYSKLVEIK